MNSEKVPSWHGIILDVEAGKTILNIKEEIQSHEHVRAIPHLQEIHFRQAILQDSDPVTMLPPTALIHVHRKWECVKWRETKRCSTCGNIDRS